MRVAGKTLVVTGAGAAIGRAVTLEAVRRGARVAAVDADPAALRETARQVVAPLLLSTHLLDPADRAAAEDLPPAVITRWGSVDGVILCSGTASLAGVLLPLLHARQEAHLVNVVAPGEDAGKAAARRFADGLRPTSNVQVSVVVPVDAAVDATYRAARDLLDGMERDAYRSVLGADPTLLDRLRRRVG